MGNWWHLLWDKCHCFKKLLELCRTNQVSSFLSMTWIILSPWNFPVLKLEQFLVLRSLCYRCMYILLDQKKSQIDKERRIKICDFQNRISYFSLLEHWFMCQANFDLKISFWGMIFSRDNLLSWYPPKWNKNKYFVLQNIPPIILCVSALFVERKL